MMEKKYLFEKEIRLFGLKRSGNAAFLSFIYPHFKMMAHLHNTRFTFRHGHQKERRKNRGYKEINFATERGIQLDCFLNTTENWPIAEISQALYDPNYLYFQQRKEITERYGFEFFSKEQFNVVVIRSPENNLASILEWVTTKGLNIKWQYYLDNFEELWIGYAKEVIGETALIPKRVIFRFERWFSSESYRKDLASEFGLDLNDAGLNIMSRRMGTSFRFDKKNKKQTQKMGVLDRYQFHRDHPIMRRVMANPEVIRLRKEIIDGNVL